MLNSEPIYINIYKTLKNEIFKGKLKNGDFFPSENELTKRFNVTRSTIRHAVNLMVNEGLLEKQQGKRIRVCLNKISLISWNFRSFSEVLRAQNSNPITKCLGFEKVTIEHDNYYKLTRIRGIEQGNKAQYLTKEISILPQKKFPDLERFDFSQESLYEVMRREYMIYPCNGTSTLSAIMCDDELAHYFDIEKDTPIILAHQEILDHKEQLVEKVDIYYSPFLKIKIARDCGH